MATTLPITLSVNGERRTAHVPTRLLLVHLLRETFGLTGTHVGCDTSSCGACTVQLEGAAVKSCTVLAVQADGVEITTIEGFGREGAPRALQAGFASEHGVQCGYCTPGMIMAATDLLERNPEPSDDEVREALAGNLCRCTGYQNIVRAVLTAAAAGVAERERTARRGVTA